MAEHKSHRVRADKRRLRAEMKARRAALSPRERHRASACAAEALLASSVWREARAVALFHSMGDEIATAPLLEAAWKEGRALALPITPPLGNALDFRWVDAHSPLARSRFGALEPESDALRAPLAALDLIIVPGLAFDFHGHRLGYGGGYYDRSLAKAPASAHAVMLAFACQTLEVVPTEEHDEAVASVLTEAGWLR